jgi:hypothetical protein
MTLSTHLLRATVAQLKRESDRTDRGAARKRCFGIQADAWSGPDQLDADGETLRIVFCKSSLAVRQALDSVADEGQRIVVITPCNGADLGIDVEARVVRNKFQRPDPWQAVRDRFRADGGIAPNVPKPNWLRDALLEVAETELPTLSTSTVLDLETVRSTLFVSLGLPRHPDLRTLVDWAEERSVAEWSRRPKELQECVATWLEDVIGLAARAIIDLVSAGHGDKARSFGLVARLFLETARVSSEQRELLVKASGRAEALLQRRSLDSNQIAPWVEVVEAELHSELGPEHSRKWQHIQVQADQLLAHLGLESLSFLSRCLSSGLRAREEILAAELSVVLDSGVSDLSPVSKAIDAVLEHKLAEVERKGRLKALPMCLKLLRWLRTPVDSADGFSALAKQYVTGECFVDWARERLEYPEPVQRPLLELWRLVANRREEFNRRFAQSATAHFAGSLESDSIIPLEQALERVVAPLMKVRKVAVIVLDGASLAVFREIQADFEQHGWREMGPTDPATGRGRSLAGLALMPTVTEVSRTSLLCGQPTKGDAATEKAGFAAHAALRHGSKKPQLFHKDAITDERLGMTEAAVRALSSDGPQVVGFVLNAIDDWLAKSDSDAAHWSIERIKPLMEILEHAAQADRVVVVTSDHGHVREHNTQCVDGGDGTRYRLQGPLRDQEVMLRGPRVVTAGSQVIAPWTEALRYSAAKQHGYHGGATPQELLVPLSIFIHRGNSADGYEETPFLLPPWWQDGVASPAVSTKAASQKRTAKTQEVEPQRVQALPFASQGRALIAELFKSEIYDAQRKLAQRARIDDSKFESMLNLMVEQGGTMTLPALAARLQVPESRARGYVVAMRRVLNLDGVEVLAFDEQAGTLTLHANLLRVQFGIEEV